MSDLDRYFTVQPGWFHDRLGGTRIFLHHVESTHVGINMPLAFITCVFVTISVFALVFSIPFWSAPLLVLGLLFAVPSILLGEIVKRERVLRLQLRSGRTYRLQLLSSEVHQLEQRIAEAAEQSCPVGL